MWRKGFALIWASRRAFGAGCYIDMAPGDQIWSQLPPIDPSAHHTL